MAPISTSGGNKRASTGWCDNRSLEWHDVVWNTKTHGTENKNRTCEKIIVENGELWHQPVLAGGMRELVLVGMRNDIKTFLLESGFMHYRMEKTK